MTDAERPSAPEAGQPTTPETAPVVAAADDATPDAHEAPPAETEEERAARESGMPDYKGEPLDAERGPGLGCFWIQIGLLTFFLIFTPLTVTWGWDSRVSAALLIFTLILLLFSGQTIIFLLRLVAADRRTRRAPLDPSAKPTVGQMEDMPPTTDSAESASGNESEETAPGVVDDDG